MTKAEQLDLAAKQCMNQHYVKDLALGYLRYEAIRKLTPQEFSDISGRNLFGGDSFDGLVDELIIEGLTSGREQAE